MLCSTEGIVFNYIKFKESSIITKIFTRELGIRNYIVNGVRSNKNSKIALFQPLSFLDLVVYNRESSSLNRISEVKCIDPFIDLRTNTLKIFITFFLSEVLSKTVKEESGNYELFEFLKKSLIIFNQQTVNLANYHLTFLSKLSLYLGFFPETSEDLLHCCEEKTFSDSEKQVLGAVLNSEFSAEIKISSLVRKKILNALLQFYQYNVDNMASINSAKILEEVLERY